MTLLIQKKLKRIVLTKFFQKNTTMKAKHLLFSSIFLSMGFAACTNEVEEFASQTQDYPGVELSKGFSINVNNADFAADAETRAAFEQVGTKWIPAWGKDADGNPDAIGAAWFSKFKYDADGKVVSPVSVFEQLGEYGSNAKFVWQGGQTFESAAISKLGAYVLYYPFNESLTDDMTKIPVVGIKENQEFDVENPTEQVTKNITAANVAVFKESGAEAPEFTIQQIPNLYALSFYMKDLALMSLTDDIKITHVMVEAKAGEVGAIYTGGYIYPSNTDPGVKYYNGTETNANNIPEIRFQGEGLTDRMMIEVKNSNEDYYISEAGAENGTKQFFFSMLPINDAGLDYVSFKVIAKVGNKTKVFYKDVDLAKSYVKRMAETGETIALNVGLENVAEFDGIYSVEQFIEEWNNEATSFNLQIPLILTDLSTYEGGADVNFALAKDKAVTFTGMPVTLPSISGNYTFENEVTINGDANLVGGGAKKAFNVSGNLTVDGTSKAVTLSGVSTVGGTLTTYGNVTIKGKNTVITKTVSVKNGKLTLPNNTEINGSVNINTDTDNNPATISTLIASGAKIKSTLAVNYDTEAIMSGAWSAKTVNVYGTLSQTKSATATVDKLNVTQKAGKNKPVLNMTEGTVIFKDLTVNEAIEGGVEIKAAIGNAEIAGNVIAKSPVTFNGEVHNMGNITAAADVTFGAAVNKVGDIAGANATPATGKITFNGAVTKAGTINAANTVTFKETAATNDINTSAAVVFAKAATTGAIETSADVTFTGEAKVLGDITADGADADVTFANNAILMTEVTGAENIYHNVTLKNEATLSAKGLTAKNVNVEDQYSTLTVDNKLDVKGTLTAKGKVIAPVKEASTINTLTIEPGITVDMSEATVVATINNLTTKAKGEYVGFLKGITSIGNGENMGKIEGKTTITGTFKQSGDLIGDVTVNTGATFTVAANLNNKISNNGTVTVDNGITVNETITNNAGAVINLNGTAKKVSAKAKSVVYVSETGNLTLGTANAGTIYVKNNSTFNANSLNAGNVAYVWNAESGEPVNGTGANQNILDIITQIDMIGATVEKMSEMTSVTELKTLNISGTWTLPAATKSTNALDLNKYAINVTDNAEFTSTGKCYVKNAKVSVNTQKTLTVSDLFIFDINCAVELEKDAKFSGNKNSATVSYK